MTLVSLYNITVHGRNYEEYTQICVPQIYILCIKANACTINEQEVEKEKKKKRELNCAEQ